MIILLRPLNLNTDFNTHTAECTSGSCGKTTSLKRFPGKPGLPGIFLCRAVQIAFVLFAFGRFRREKSSCVCAGRIGSDSGDPGCQGKGGC